MDPVLNQAASALNINLPGLRKAAQKTDGGLTQAKDAAEAYVNERAVSDPDKFDIVAYGSIARQEMGYASDFDWLVVANGYSTDPRDFSIYKAAAEEARYAVSADEPGASGLFGTVIGATELVNTIGLEEDTNLQHTRRILTLEESVSLLKPQRHRELKKAITARYLHDQQNEAGKIPRFLLNDVVRYWRTVAVDYQAKRWEEDHKQVTKWGLRLLKLRTTRKLTYAGTVATLFLPAMRGEPPRVDQLVDEWERPPVARLASWHELLKGDARNALARVIEAADYFVDLLSQYQLREEAKAVDHPRKAMEGSQLREAYERTHELDTALNDLFLSSDPIASSSGSTSLSISELTRRYLLF